MQQLWKLKLDWDEIVPKELETQWVLLWKPIKELEKIRVPRWLKIEKNVQIQIHGFADASTKAYGTVIYLRSLDNNGKITCQLISSKSRIAPLKTVNIPRLELTAADLLSQLVETLRNSMEFENAQHFLWSDSTITLQWINKPVHELKVFVANRVKSIKKYTDVNIWEHVRTEQNPADLISRGVLPENIVNNLLWWNRPEWLTQPQEQWPQPINWRAIDHSNDMKLELKVHIAQENHPFLEVFVPEHTNCTPLLDYSENLSKLLNIGAYVRRFVYKCKQKILSKRISKEQLKRLQNDVIRKEFIRKHVELPNENEKNSALKMFIKHEQSLEFAKERAHFNDKENVSFPEKSKIIALRPFMDGDGLIRVGGRLGNAHIPYDTKHPIIIPNGSRLCWLIIAEAHKVLQHAAIQLMMQYIRASFWIPKLRNELRAYVHKCVICARHAKKLENQLMSDLPADRVNRYRAFLITGVDYAGPIELCERYKSRPNKTKGWIVVFVCMITRAIMQL